MTSGRNRKVILCSLVVWLLASSGVRAGDNFVYQSPDGTRYVVSGKGLSQIDLGEKTVARGQWLFQPADWMFTRAGKLDASWKMTASTFQRTGENSVSVVQEYPQFRAAFDYFFRGEDVLVKVRVENFSEKTIRVSRFGSLTFDFGENPEGIMPVWHISYLQATEGGCFHPSHLNRIGGSYATGKDFGVGLSPAGQTLRRTLFLWDLPDWSKQEVKNPRHLSFFVAEAVPAGGANSFQFILRLSREKRWSHLLEPYRDYFQKVLGPVRYQADYRLLAVAHVNRNVESISPENPYGFHGGFRRLDLAEGVKAFCDTLVPALKTANGHGVIIWGQSGTDPRGAMYRPDFDVLPPEVKRNWTVIDRRFREAGLRHGVCTRPGEMAVRIDWQKDGTVRINPEDGQQLELLWQRFKNMMELGCSLFYLDSFGARWEDVKIMQFLREKMGPGIQTFAEHQCDAIMPFTGAYTETDFYEAGQAAWAKESGYYPRAGLRNWEIYRWLVPGVQMISRLYDVHGSIPKDFEPVERFFYRHRITPMIEDYTLPGRAGFLRDLQAQYLKESEFK